MRRQRGQSASQALLVVLLLISVAACVSAVQTEDAGFAPFQIAEAFASISDQNTTNLLDDVVAIPASLEREKAVPVLPAESEPRDLRPIEVSTAAQQTRSLTTDLPYGGALVAVEVTAILVGGATIAVLLIAKVKSRFAANHYEYVEDYVDPMLQSLLYSDMDYAAI